MYNECEKISGYSGVTRKIKEYTWLLGSNYKVIATKGHVRDLPKSELGIDIENDFEPKYITIRGKGKYWHNFVKKLKKPIRSIWQLTLTERERQLVGIYCMP